MAKRLAPPLRSSKLEPSRLATLGGGLLVVSGVLAAGCFLLPVGDCSIASAVFCWPVALGVLGLLLVVVLNLLVSHCCSHSLSANLACCLL